MSSWCIESFQMRHNIHPSFHLSWQLYFDYYARCVISLINLSHLSSAKKKFCSLALHILDTYTTKSVLFTTSYYWGPLVPCYILFDREELKNKNSCMAYDDMENSCRDLSEDQSTKSTRFIARAVLRLRHNWTVSTSVTHWAAMGKLLWSRGCIIPWHNESWQYFFTAVVALGCYVAFAKSRKFTTAITLKPRYTDHFWQRQWRFYGIAYPNYFNTER